MPETAYVARAMIAHYSTQLFSANVHYVAHQEHTLHA